MFPGSCQAQYQGLRSKSDLLNRLARWILFNISLTILSKNSIYLNQFYLNCLNKQTVPNDVKTSFYIIMKEIIII